MKTTFFDTNGNPVDASVACDSNGVIRHGFRMKTNLMMMDSADVAPLNRPGSFAVSDAEHDARSADIEARDTALSNAWRNPDRVADTSAAQSNVHPTSTVDMDAVYDAHDKRLQEAWRQPAL
jgi:hypothetical protein